MNEEQILGMSPGRELDMLVAKHVMGHEVVADEIMGDTEQFLDQEGDTVWGTLQPYSQEMSTAASVVEKMKQKGFADAETWADYGSGNYQPAEAICKRALVEILL